MQVIKTDFEGLFIVELKAFFDERGYFTESYNENFYKTLGITDNFVQDNISVSKKGVVRGLHFQNVPHAQGKLVSVLRGKVFEVAVDIRKDSPTFGKYFSCELSEENKKQVFIPVGFAHGFMALVDDTIFSYKCTDVWNKESEGGLLWNDEEINIVWPDGEKVISEKDKTQDSFKVLKSKIGII